MDTLKSVDGIGIVEFDKRDIVRHRLVKYIVEAFERREELENGLRKNNNDNN
jgi:phosphate starvation-inducible PhoH-like protein